MLDTWELDPTLAFEENKPKALDVFGLVTSTGADSRARRYVVHNVDGDQEPILIFHSFEYQMKDYADYILFSISPHNSRSMYLCSMKLESPLAVSNLLVADTVLNMLGLENDLQDLEASPRNTYPFRVSV